MIRWLIRSAMIAMYPRTEQLPGVEDCDPDVFLDRFRKESSMLVWLGVLGGALFFQAGPIITLGVPLPFAWLPAGLRQQYVRKVSGHPIYHLRQLIFLVKFAAGLCWGAHPLVRAQLALPNYAADPGTWRSA